MSLGHFNMPWLFRLSMNMVCHRKGTGRARELAATFATTGSWVLPAAETQLGYVPCELA